MPLIPIYQWTDYVITEVDDFIVVTSTCGMTAMFDGKKTAKVIISEEDGDKTNGICGICNGLPDDFKTADGTDVSNEKDKFKKIGNSYARPPLDSCKCVTMKQCVSSIMPNTILVFCCYMHINESFEDYVNIEKNNDVNFRNYS